MPRARKLRRLGCEPIEASNGAEALRVFEAHHDDIAWVLMDLAMPEMDGDVAFAAMHAMDPRFRGAAPFGYLPKPYTSADLGELLRRLGA